MINRILPSILMLLGFLSSGLAFDPLEKVEEDQSAGLLSSKDIFNRNIAMGSRQHYTRVSSYRPGSFGQYAHDGSADTAWISSPGQTGAWLEISWGLSVPVNQVDILEKNGEAIQSLTLELYNGRSWEMIEPHDVARRNNFHFATRPASALRISIETNDEQAGIVEVEVYNTESTNALPRYGAADLVAAMTHASAVVLFEGSPYAYNLSGRTLIKPRVPEACLADLWTKPVLEFICAGLGGRTETAEADTLKVSLNGQMFAMDTGPGTTIMERIEALAEQAGLEFMRQGSLVMVGLGLEALSDSAIISELSDLLGRNPYLIGDRSKPEADAIITPTMNQEGITYEWAGFRSTADPDTNADAWLKYSETKAVRSWVGSPRHMDRYIRPEKMVESAEDFETFKSQIRAAPETNSVIAWRAFLKKYHEQLSREFGTYNTLGINVINATGPKDWPDTLHYDFINWASCYALTYYLAKHYGVAAHQYGNEPDWYFNKSTEEQIARRLTLVADAVHCAIEDVNRDYNRNVNAIFSAPVLAGDFMGRSARIMMRYLYTRYDGSRSPTRLFQLFNRHRYSGRPHQNALEVRRAKEMMQEEAGEVLPQVFTELNYATGRHWGNPTTTYLNDTPSVFTAIAGIWGWMMQEQGVYGIFVFKLNDPGIWSWKDTGPFSNTITYSMYPEQDPGTERKAREQVGYGSKNFEVCRLFGKGFHGSRPLLQTDIVCSDPEYRSWTTFDADSERFYIWSVQVDESASYELEFDLGKLDLPPDALVTAETVSGARHGEVTQVITLPEDRKIRIHQAPQSAMLLTVHKRPVTRDILYPEADAMVAQGDRFQTNFGDETQLGVGRHSNNQSNKISFLKFKLPEGTVPVERVVLELHGQANPAYAYDGGFMFRVYAIEENEWNEQSITADNAPNVYRTVSALKKINLDNYPVGHVTCFGTPSKLMVDVTRAVQEARENKRDELSLVLIREMHWPEENTDAFSAVISSREAGPEESPKLYVWE